MATSLSDAARDELEAPISARLHHKELIEKMLDHATASEMSIEGYAIDFLHSFRSAVTSIMYSSNKWNIKAVGIALLLEIYPTSTQECYWEVVDDIIKQFGFVNWLAAIPLSNLELLCLLPLPEEESKYGLKLNAFIKSSRSSLSPSEQDVKDKLEQWISGRLHQQVKPAKEK